MNRLTAITASPDLASETNQYSSLFVNRGPDGGNMMTDALHLVVEKQKVYRLGKNGLETSASSSYAIDLETRATRLNLANNQKPVHLTVAAVWDKTPHETGSGNNILGDNGRLTLPFDTLGIPCIAATAESLAYYGATLLKEGDLVQFPDVEYPIFKMTVGPGYVDGFLMSEKGGGFYLEYHYDKPHFHMPLQGGGFYILARWEDLEKTKLHITGFRIPDGQAVYTMKGAIHCDATLTGKLIVGYDKAEGDHSTVLLRTVDDKKVKIIPNE